MIPLRPVIPIYKSSLYRPRCVPNGLTPDWDGLPDTQYSLMKHGCVDSRYELSEKLARLILASTDPNEQYRIVSSSYLRVPSAADQMLSDMLSFFLPDNFHYSRLYRKEIILTDFAGLSFKDRTWFSDLLACTYDDELRDAHLIVVDDAYVTGTHEYAIRDQLAGVVKSMHFFYVVDLSGLPDPSLESILNKVAVKHLHDLLPLQNHPEFTYNNRILKWLFTSKDEDFQSYLSLISAEDHRILLNLALKEGYDKLTRVFTSKIMWLSKRLDTKNEGEKSKCT